MWGEITHSFPNINGATVEVKEWMSIFLSHFVSNVITNPCYD